MYIHRTGNILDLNRFNDEVKVAIPKVQIVLKFSEDDLRFTVSSNWGSSDDTALDSFISSFVDVDPEDKIPKIIDLAKSEAKGKHFHNIIYTSNKELISSLVPVRENIQGEVRRVVWYRTLDANQLPIDPVIEVDIAYTRDTTGFALFRTTARTYINRDGTSNPEIKYSQKFYFVNPDDMIDEGIKRRSLLVKSIKIPALEYLTAILVPMGVSVESAYLRGLQFLDDYEDLFNKFMDNSSTITNPADPNFGRKTIIVSLEDNTSEGINGPHNEWLDGAPNALGGSKTIRQWLIEEFSI